MGQGSTQLLDGLGNNMYTKIAYVVILTSYVIGMLIILPAGYEFARGPYAFNSFWQNVHYQMAIYFTALTLGMTFINYILSKP